MGNLMRTPAAKLSIIEELVDANLLTYEQMKELIIGPFVDIETKVQAIKINGMEVLEWVV